MPALFISYAHEDTVCTERILQSLAASGYTVWREPDYQRRMTDLTPTSSRTPSSAAPLLSSSGVRALL
jgi:predicted alpha/beta superfamily hydrolase